MVFVTDGGIRRGSSVGLRCQATRVLHNGNLHDTAGSFAYSTTKTMDASVRILSKVSAREQRLYSPSTTELVIIKKVVTNGSNSLTYVSVDHVVEHVFDKTSEIRDVTQTLRMNLFLFWVTMYCRTLVERFTAIHVGGLHYYPFLFPTKEEVD
jgi:hypothetical protein